MAKGKGKEKNEPTSSEPDPNLHFSTGEFTLPNGDTYAGEYCAHRYGLIWREGHGVYTTKDGQIYEGEWKDDKLVEQKELVVKFPSGEEYRGTTMQDKYQGAGTYIMDNKMDVSCEFIDNKPKGSVVLIDINGRVWQGEAGENKALLLPENLFYFNITQDTGTGKLKLKYQEKEELAEGSKKSQEAALSDRELEKIIFGKSTKTLNDIDFTESKWCQRYLRYRKMKDTISEKLKEEEEGAESLTEEEKKWYRKCRKHKLEQRQKTKEKKLAQAKTSTVDTSLLATFYSKEFQESCPPIRVFHPSCDWVENYVNTTETVVEVEEEKAIEEVEKEVTTIEVVEEKEGKPEGKGKKK